jgi:hypothetical protein
MAWVISILAMTLVALDLPLPVRIGICVGAATASVHTIQSLFLLAGPRAIRALFWTETGAMRAFIGDPPRELTVVVAPGSSRLGRGWLLLRLETCDRSFDICIDGAKQEPRAFRRLCRQLENLRDTFPDEGRGPS